MSIDDATPEEWNRVSRGPDTKEECLMSAQKPKTITGSLYHPNDHNLLDKQMFPKEDVVNHPAHYNKGGVEAIDYIEQQLSEGFKYYLVGNVYKYLHRWEYKDGLQDLKKAQWYLNRMISDIEDTT
tara:strand:+ start:635 stop:1012 length:378 start_codon:yes stop_codon:yes gene_type:complete